MPPLFRWAFPCNFDPFKKLRTDPSIPACGKEAMKASETADSEAAGSATEAASGEGRVVKLGLTGVIYEDIWNPIKEELAQEGVDLEYVQFSDYSLPNEALNAGELDINAFQHQQ